MTPEQEIAWTRAGQMLYAEAGITTAHEGATHLAQLQTMKRAADAGANIIDVVAYPVHHRPGQDPRGVPRLRVGQVRQAPQDRRRQDHDRRLAAGPDRGLHDAVPDRRAGRREELEGRAVRPAGDHQRGAQEGLRPRRSGDSSTSTATRRSTPSSRRTSSRLRAT